MTKILYNNQLLDHCDQVIDCRDRGFLLADGIFETIRAYRGKTPYLEKHWQRLKDAANIIAIPWSISFEDLYEKIILLLQENKLHNADASIRVTLTRGVGPRGLSVAETLTPNLLITAQAYEAKLFSQYQLHTSHIRRNEFSPTANIKTLSYIDNVLAKMVAMQVHADDALLLNTKGNIACTSCANIFFIDDSELITPAITEGIIPGITRQIVMELAKELGFTVKETVVAVSALANIAEAFITNSLIGIQPVTQIDSQIIGSGEWGKVTQELLKYAFT